MDLNLMLTPFYVVCSVVGGGLSLASLLGHGGHDTGAGVHHAETTSDQAGPSGLSATWRQPRHAVLGALGLGLAGLGADLAGSAEVTALLAAGIGGVACSGVSALIWRGLDAPVTQDLQGSLDGELATVILPASGTRERGTPARVRVVVGQSSRDVLAWPLGELKIGQRVRLRRDPQGELTAESLNAPTERA